jgi:hypothetical protein
LYFEAAGEEELRRVRPEVVINNENIDNRKKFIRPYLDSAL